MHLNARGEWAMGQGGLPGSIWNSRVQPPEPQAVNVPDGMGAKWYGDNIVVYPRLSSPGIVLWDRLTSPVEVSNRGVNDLMAGGGVWAAWANDGHGITASYPLPVPPEDPSKWTRAGLLAVGPTGEIAYVPNRQEGTGAHVLERSGGIWLLSTGVVFDLQLLGNFRAVWTFNQSIFVHGLPTPHVLPGGVWGPKVVERTPGEFYNCYFSGQFGVVMHRLEDASQGYVIAAPGVDAFNHAMVALPDGRLKIAWSARAGEVLGDERERIIDVLTEPMRPFVEPNDPIVPIGHPMWLAFYVGDPAGPGGWHTDMAKTWPPGNAYLDVITSTIRKDDGTQIAKYLHAGGSMTIPEIEQRVSEMAADGSIVAAYYDGTSWPGVPTFPSGTVQLVQAYKFKNESFATFEQRVEVEIARIETERPQHVPGLNPQSYLRNDLEANLSALVPVYARIARRHPRLTFMTPFSGTGRANGLWQNTSAVPYWNELFAGVTGDPASGGGGVSAPNELAVVEQVNREFPHLLQTNTIVSCTEFTQRVLERLNAEWGHVGKTAGEGQGVPVGFTPRQVRGVDGNMHLITGVSYDVIFHEPTWRQVDIISKGTANEPGPWEHGPGAPMWGEIEPEHYRAHNPWLEKFPLVVVPPDPPPGGDKPTLLIIRYPDSYQRGTLEGLVVVTNVSRPTDGAFVDLLELWLNDGAPRMRFKLEPPGGTWDLSEKDLPYLPTVGWKPDINGTFDLFARCRTADGRWSDDIKGDHQVTITSP